MEMEIKPMQKDYEVASQALSKKNWKQIEEIEQRNPGLFTYSVLESEGLHDIWLFKMGETIDTFKKDYIKSRKMPTHPRIIERFQKELNKLYHRSNLDAPLLIIGEIGTSKEFMARAVHKLSSRRGKAFEEINCSAISENLLESELFGHKKGAFTGATTNRKGILMAANGGAVFLDEIGKMPEHLQAKLLKVVDERGIRPVGSDNTEKIDIHFIAAIQPKDIGGMLPDLLSRFPNHIKMPPLKERLAKVPEIFEHSLKRLLDKEKDSGLKDMSLGVNWLAMEPLLTRDYSNGNYRELEEILMTAVISAKVDGRNVISYRDLKEAVNEYEHIHGSAKTDSSVKDQVKNVKCKDIIDYANKARSSIVEAKIDEVLSNGKNLKSVLMSEGLSEKEYYNFRKKVVTITGKNLKDLGA